jgi:hypothetical protein
MPYSMIEEESLHRIYKDFHMLVWKSIYNGTEVDGYG